MLLKEVADVKGGKRLPKTDQLTEYRTNHPYIRIRDMYQNYKLELTDDFEYITEETYQKIKRYTVNSGDIIIAVVGNTIGLVGLIGESLNGANLTENCNKLVNIKNYDSRFLYYFLKSPVGQEEIKKGIVGSSQPKLPIYNIEKFELPDIEISKQVKISSLIEILDKRISCNEQINKNLAHQVQLIFQHTFLDEENNGWPVEKLGSFLSLQRGVSYKGKYLSEKDGVPMVNLGNILPNSVFRPEKLKYYTGDYKEKVVVKPGDIVIANTDLTQAREVLGSAILIPDLGYPTIICSHHISIVKDCRISIHFILGMLNSPIFRERVVGFATGTTVLALPNEAILNCEFSLPPNELIAEYDLIAESFHQKAEQIRKENQKLTILRDSLLPKLMSGELDVSELSL